MWKLSRRRIGLVAVGCLALGAAVIAVVSAGARSTAFPGKNGRIVFNDQSGRLMIVNADGSGVVRIAQTGTSDQTIGASFSPDGQFVAYSRSGSSDPDIFTVRPDGSDQHEVTFSRGQDIDPTWSGDGSQIAFETNRNGNWGTSTPRTRTVEASSS